MLTGSLGLALLCVVVVVAGGIAVTAEAKHHFIGNALMDMKDSIELSFKLGKAVVSVLMEELTEDIIEAQKRLALRTLQKDSQDIPGVISSVIGAIRSVTPYQKLDRDLTIPPVDVFPADIQKDIGVTIFPKPILDIPDVDSIPATERESDVIIENPPYIPKNIIDIFPESVNEGETIIRMDGGFEGASKTVDELLNSVSYTNQHSKGARWVPQNLKEKLAFEQALSDPSKGTILNMKKGMTDKRWHQDDGWVKMSQNINGVEVHYVWNKILNVYDDFKIK